ncbi:YesN/AraC family two-component response regulator [Sphingobacterium zeae]|uniref:YesN/AraC family two-component response regulator n=1 Tax=Sphingobacterium zeae TaxID=1776859 RepID=A0ABU0TZQ4_9SPHI|nr:helix-turn-helix domain-containing protein [Sphingobacterium zeae]MDQ1148189.1 YesN/AraC family two-component response regulator [Sphingobacterium zeae]
MNLKMDYNDLFTLINCILSVVNLLLLLFFVLRYIQSRKNAQVIALPLADDIRIENNDGEETICSKDELKCADVLMSKITEDRLVEQFERAQAARFFLKKGVSLQDLADLLGTNQRYASYILNRHVGLDFNNYIQQARIEYLINSVELNPDLLNVKFSVLAEKAGFSSISKFSSVFKAVKGIPPSEYFQRLRMTL